MVESMMAPDAASSRQNGPGTAPPADEAVVWAQNLVKTYGDEVALDGLSVTVQPGELFGFIGPDGAGKTTLFRILTSLLTPDEGAARVLGLDVEAEYRELRPRLGYMAGEFSLYPDLSVDENLQFYASVFGTTVEAQMDMIRPVYKQLEPFGNRRADALSGGMKQKLALSCALVHRPELLVLDEPTTGVDAVSRRDFWTTLTRLTSEDGLPVIVSTPYMDEAILCDRVALIQNGALLVVDAPEAIQAGYEWPLVAVQTDRRYEALRLLRDVEHTHSVFPFGATLHYSDARPDASPERVAEEVRTVLRERGIEAEVHPIEAGIEDVFMDLGSASEKDAPARRSRSS
jgi:ABC-type multidrug transport system ATPase subunit